MTGLLKIKRFLTRWCRFGVRCPTDGYIVLIIVWHLQSRTLAIAPAVTRRAYRARAMAGGRRIITACLIVSFHDINLFRLISSPRRDSVALMNTNVMPPTTAAAAAAASRTTRNASPTNSAAGPAAVAELRHRAPPSADGITHTRWRRKANEL